MLRVSGWEIPWIHGVSKGNRDKAREDLSYSGHTTSENSEKGPKTNRLGNSLDPVHIHIS